MLRNYRRIDHFVRVRSLIFSKLQIGESLPIPHPAETLSILNILHNFSWSWSQI